MIRREIRFLLLPFLFLLVIAITGCHRAQDGTSHIARKVKAPHPPTAVGEAAPHPPPPVREPAPPHDGMRGNATAGGGTALDSAPADGGGSKGGGGILDAKSGGGGKSPATVDSAVSSDDEAVGEKKRLKKAKKSHQQDALSSDAEEEHAKKGARKSQQGVVPTNASFDPDQALQDAVDNLPVGQVVFNHPNEMKMGEASEVQVRISRELATDISGGLGSAQTTERQQIKVSTSMKVQLHGEPYFDVKPLTSEEQLIDKTGFTEWKFTVVALQGGKWPLHLTVTAVVHAADREKVKDLKVLDEQVTVRVSALEVVQAFVGNNWQWIIGTILIPVGAWLLPKLRKRKAQAKAA